MGEQAKCSHFRCSRHGTTSKILSTQSTPSCFLNCTQDHSSVHEPGRSGKPQLECILPQKINSQDFKTAFFFLLSNYLIRLWKAGFSRWRAFQKLRTSQRQEEVPPQWGENKLVRLRSNWLRSDPFLWLVPADFRGKKACYFGKSPSRGKAGQGWDSPFQFYVKNSLKLIKSRYKWPTLPTRSERGCWSLLFKKCPPRPQVTIAVFASTHAVNWEVQKSNRARTLTNFKEIPVAPLMQ